MKMISLLNKRTCKSILLLLSLTGITITYAQQIPLHQKHETSRYTIEPSDTWSRLFKRKTGWNGGDGIYSIKLPKGFQSPLADNKKDNILFLFSDSVIDTLVNDSPSAHGFTMIHNAVAILSGLQPDSNAFHFYWPVTNTGWPASVFKPAEKSTKQDKPADDSIYYWLGDGMAINSSRVKNIPAEASLAIFAYKMINVSSEPFGFRDIDNELLLTNDHFKILRRVKIPKLAEGNFGAGIYRAASQSKDPYIYIYGVRGQHKGLVVARTTNKNLAVTEKWQYYTGAGWSSDIGQCTDITAHVSNELSVTPTPDGQFALIFQQDGIQPYIGLKLAPTPYGPFGPMDTLWHCPEPNATNKLLVYNAKAHPSISPKGSLLISYNVNSLEFLKTMKREPTFYRPRFLLLKWK